MKFKIYFDVSSIVFLVCNGSNVNINIINTNTKYSLVTDLNIN